MVSLACEIELCRKLGQLSVSLSLVSAMSLGGRGGDDLDASDGLRDLKLFAIKTIEDVASLPADAQRVELWTHDLAVLDALADFDAARSAIRLRDVAVLPPTPGFPELRVEFDDRALAQVARMSGLERFAMLASKEVTDVGLLQLARLPRLECLLLWDCPLSDDTLRSLQNLPRLRKLGLAGVAGTMTSLEFLDSLPQIRELDLYSQWQLRARDLLPIRHLSKLHRLGLCGVNGHRGSGVRGDGRRGDSIGVDDATLEWVAGLELLEELLIARCHSVTDAGLRELGSLHRLKSLYVSGCTGLTRAGFLELPASIVELLACGTLIDGRALARLPHLRRLAVDASTEMGETWMHLDGALLERLEIAFVSPDNDPAPVPATFLQRCAALRELELSAPGIEREHLAAIGRMRDLRLLWIEPVPDFDTHMPLLAGLTRLQELCVGETGRLTGENLVTLRDLPIRRLLINESAHERARAIWPSADIED